MPLLLLLSAATFVVGIGAFAVIGVISPLSRDLGLTPVGASWVMSSYALAYAVGSPLLTSATGRFDRRTVLILGMALFGLGVLASALATNPTLLYAGRVVTALGAGLYSPTAAGVAIASVPIERRGQALSIVYAGLTLAQVAGVPAGGYLGYLLGWSQVFWIVAALAAAMTLALALRVPRAIDVAPARLSDLVSTLVNPRLAGAVLLTASVMCAGWIPYTFLAPIIEEKTGGGPEVVALLLVVYGFGSVAGNLLGGVLTDRVGPNRALLVATVLPVPMMAAVTLIPWHQVWLGGLLLFAWASVGWAISVPQQARLVALDPARTQVLLSLSAACIYIGASVGSLVAGFAKSMGGIPAIGIAAILAGLIGIAHLALTLSREQRQAATT
ncbi:MFS transporter [Phreatobacter stygius]|nr:MFS transporter [Phreatobacter stygius]